MPRPAIPSHVLFPTLLLVVAALPASAQAQPATPFPVQLPQRPPPDPPDHAVPPPEPFPVALQPDPPQARVVHVKKPAGPPLPDPALRVRVVAPSAKGLWTLHLENEGDKWLRVPADLRLLHLTIESGDTLSRRPAKTAHCALPQALHVAAFPERNALLLGPGDSYVEHFDPRLFCFGKDSAAIAGGALVRVRYGWEDRGFGAKKADGPFAVEGTTYPPAVEPKRELVGPSMVLSWLPPDDEPEPGAADHEGAAEEKVAEQADAEPKQAKEHENESAKEHEQEHAKEHLPVDENAPRLELTGPAFVDAPDAFRVTFTLKVANVGHRTALAAVRTRMLGFRVEGPDGVVHCHAARPTNTLPREAFTAMKPGGSTSLTIIVQEACDQDLFRRPGLYRVFPSLHLDDHSVDTSIVPVLGVIHAKKPTLVRIADGPEPFYKSPPQPLRAGKAENGEDKPGDP